MPDERTAASKRAALVVRRRQLSCSPHADQQHRQCGTRAPCHFFYSAGTVTFPVCIIWGVETRVLGLEGCQRVNKMSMICPCRCTKSVCRREFRPT